MKPTLLPAHTHWRRDTQAKTPVLVLDCACQNAANPQPLADITPQDAAFPRHQPVWVVTWRHHVFAHARPPADDPDAFTRCPKPNFPTLDDAAKYVIRTYKSGLQTYAAIQRSTQNHAQKIDQQADELDRFLTIYNAAVQTPPASTPAA